MPEVEKLLETSLYKPPNCIDADFFDLLDSHLDSLEKFKILVFLCTDSNLNLLNIDSDASAMQIVESFSAYAYSSLTLKDTCFHGESWNCIDQIWSNKPDKVILAGVCLTTYSDHFTMAVLKNLSGNKSSPKINKSYKKKI